jgi:hypothetical protein
MVREAERRGVSLLQVAAERGEDQEVGGVTAARGWDRDPFAASADRRESAGGTGRAALAEQLRQARAALARARQEQQP